MPIQSKANDVQGAWPAPSADEIYAFMSEIAPTIFGTEYVMLALAHKRTKLTICEVLTRAENGTPVYVMILPFN
jgi:hypothetical protein